MDQSKIIRELSRNRHVFEPMPYGASREEYLWKPAPDKWCLLEVICHLYDEEREDFRARVRHCLENSKKPLPPIDPLGWVKERDYIGQNFEEKIDSVIKERENSIRWLKSLQNPNWENFIEHRKLGKMSANLFLANWLAHDYIHIRQIVKIKRAYLNEFTDDSLDYAGNW